MAVELGFDGFDEFGCLCGGIELKVDVLVIYYALADGDHQQLVGGVEWLEAGEVIVVRLFE